MMAIPADFKGLEPLPDCWAAEECVYLEMPLNKAQIPLVVFKEGLIEMYEVFLKQ